MFWMVQRLVCKTDPSEEPSPLAPIRTGTSSFDFWFGCEYMGSSEFELGTVPIAAKRMQALPLAVRPVEIERRNVTRTVYFVASDDPAAYANCEDWFFKEVTSFEQAIEAFRHWVTRDRMPGLEPSYFDEHFDGTVDLFSENTCAWWSLDDNMAWTFDEHAANRLLESFNLAVAATS